MAPYRDPPKRPISEEDVWSNLDDALECAFSDPDWSLQLARWALEDSADYPNVRGAAWELVKGLLLHPRPPFWRRHR